MKLKKNEQGFTIIEVVLVLAIAGLIFLMVFIALPALQRGQRDGGRKNDVSTVAAAVNTFKSNNKNKLTGLTNATLQNSVDDLGQYEKTNVTVVGAGGAVSASTVDTVRVYLDRKCGVQNNTATPVLVSGTANRSAAVTTGLENNGTNVIAYCTDV